MISPVMEKVNRKHLFITAASLMTLALSILAGAMPNSDNIEDSQNDDDAAFQILLPMAVLMFSLCYGAGFGPAIYTWSSELFPPR